MKKAQIAGIVLLSLIVFSCGWTSDDGQMSEGGGGWGGGSGSLPSGSYGDEDWDDETFDPGNFDRIVDNPYRRAEEYPFSTFSIDVDTAGYSITRRYLQGNRMPPKADIRIEELLNYFDYNYPPPAPPEDGEEEKPFAVHTEMAPAPWNSNHLLARIAIKGKEFPADTRPKVNLVFLLDVSGSMDAQNRLPLVVSSMKLLVEQLNGTDRIAIVTYANSIQTVMPPTSCDNKAPIISALNSLRADGGTSGGPGIQRAYELAQQNFDPVAANRVILCTDGDFNIGLRGSELIDLVAEKAKSGVHLTVLGFGLDNYKDGTLKQLAIHGKGNYGYIDTMEEAKKILVNQLSGTLITIAQDVKIQVDFNPTMVGAYRLIGYENRIMRDEDFNNDDASAADIGAGHTVTAFYEIIPAGDEELDSLPKRDPSKYTPLPPITDPDYDEYLTVNVRYKLPGGTTSKLLEIPVMVDSLKEVGEETQDFRFAASVAGFGMLLRDSPYKGNVTYSSVIVMAQNALGTDEYGYRAGFVTLVEKAKSVSGKN